MARKDRLRQQLEMDPIEHDPLHRMHARRIDAGRRHHGRDLVAAPWPEDRVPGQRYDTLGQPAPPPATAHPRPPRPGADLEDRGAAIFGRDRRHGVLWPYGLEDPERRDYPNDPDGTRFDAAVRHARTAQETIVMWAETYGLKRNEHGCCPLWLTRRVSRGCSPMSCSRHGGKALDNRWLDHMVAWSRDGKPAVITSAPYGVLETDEERLSWWPRADPRLRVARGAGWYGFSTTQIVMWRVDVLDDVRPAGGERRAEPTTE
jgi:hypothetical protein